MLVHEELTLLIKSKCPVIFVESIDEEYKVIHLAVDHSPHDHHRHGINKRVVGDLKFFHSRYSG